MNNKINLKTFEIISTIFIIVGGILLHFLYDWSNGNAIVGMFSAVNESTWEHLKILFFPMLITIIIGSYYYKDVDNYLCSKTKGLILSLLFIVIAFYTYSGIMGRNFASINILIFILAVVIGEVYAYRKMNTSMVCSNFKALIALIILTLSFTIFTFKPPYIGLFKDPVDNTYGIDKEKNT